ncbi:MAG: hypothetical protein QN229_07035 [Desulfurococcaceae archaeon TW002]
MSKEELILVKRLRKLIIPTSIYSVFLGLFIIYLTITPLYVVEGVIEGYIALTRYELTFYGTPVRLDALLSVSYLSISLLILSAYLVVVGSLTLYLFFRGKNINMSVRWLFGGGLSTLASSGLVLALINRVVSTIATQLKLNLNHATSAGILYLGTSSIYTTYPAEYLLSPLVVLIVTQVYVVLATITYLHMMMIEEHRLAKYQLYREIK